jgi:hypothetical protein
MAPCKSAADSEATDAELLAKMLYGECGGVASKMEQAACAWTVLNRVDADDYPNDVRGVVTARKQFVGYRASNPIEDELLDLAKDVLGRWKREKDGETEVGRVLPEDYLWFSGNGKRNRFRNVFAGAKKYWDWSLSNPYEEAGE